VREWSGDRWSSNGRGDRPWHGTALASARFVLAPFSTRLPPELLERLRIAAPQLGLRQGEIAATALDRFLSEFGF
jgi:hypothetical protein